MLIQFGVNHNTLNNALRTVMKPCHSVFTNKIIEEIQAKDLIKVSKYPEAKLIVGATINRIHIPSGNFEDKKLFFNGKHKSYCLKSQIITNRQGLCFLIHSDFAGSYHDFRIFNEEIVDIEKLFGKHSNIKNPVILADKRYIGNVQSSSIKCLMPKRNPPNSQLLQLDIKRNRKISSEKVIIENYFERLQQKYHIMSQTFRSERVNFSFYFEICCSLTNFDIAY
jgi:hypothetical protein